ncbi:MAG TPA: LCP family protein [Actinomycetota bacterium]|nr:LCP family protein [Actinomycetota bacterium]
MRRLSVLVAGAVVALIGVNVVTGVRMEPVRAQTPAVEIQRVQDAAASPLVASKEPIFILALGSDARPHEPVNRLHSDAIQLIGINPAKGGAGILGFPRDSWVTLPGRGQTRINDAMVYGGPQLAVETVESITGIKIDYYALTSFPEFQRMVKGIGGVTIEIEYPMHDDASGTSFDPGRRRLGGADALAFARDRKSAPGGDLGRSDNQGRLLIAALKKLRKDVERNPATLLRWLRTGVENVETDLKLGEIFDLLAGATQIDPSKVRNAVVPATDGEVNGASVVFISDGAQALYDDLADDGMLAR